MVDLRINRYERSREALEQLASECVSLCVSDRLGLAVLELQGSEEISDVARGLERELFDRAFGKHVPHTPDLMTQEYGPYEDQSTFFMALEVDSGKPLGVLRVIGGMPSKSLNDLVRANLLSEDKIEQYGFEASTLWDVATAAVTQDTGDRPDRVVALTLYRALYLASQFYGITHWTSMIEAKVQQSFEHLGIPFRRFDGIAPVNYLGSDAVACHCLVDEVRSSMTAQASNTEAKTSGYIRAILDGSEFLPEPALTRNIDLTVGIDLTNASSEALQQGT